MIGETATPDRESTCKARQYQGSK